MYREVVSNVYTTRGFEEYIEEVEGGVIMKSNDMNLDTTARNMTIRDIMMMLAITSAVYFAYQYFTENKQIGA